VLNDAVIEQEVPAVAHEVRLSVGAVKPVVATAVKATLSTPLNPGKPFSAVAVIVAVGEAAPFVVVKLLPLAVIATQAG